MGRIIAIASGKGGAGKTTFVSNLATALAQFNQSVIAIDANLSTSNLGLHLGIPLYPVTIQDVLNKKARAHEAVYHHKNGFKVVPADISLRKLRKIRSNEYVELFYKLLEGADFIIIDCAAGLGQETLAAIEAADELITITNPDMPALTDSLKLINLAKKCGTANLGVVVNRVKKRPYELSRRHIENFLDLPIIGHIPEDEEVAKSIAAKEPLLTYNSDSKAAHHFRSIAAKLIGIEYKPKRSLTMRLFGWLR